MTTFALDLKVLDRTRVLTAADAYLNQAPITVTAFPALRSAGGLHDFFSEGDYWWPNPDEPGGPYIQRDGLTNPDNFVQHRQAMLRLSIHVATLVAAWKLTDQTAYAAQAIHHLRAWFVDAATRMNPHLQYAQAIFGRSTGRAIGIIDTVHLIEVARSVMLLERAGLLTGVELTSVKQWFADYLRWLTTSKNGIEEMHKTNNHASCWVLQVAAFAALLSGPFKLSVAAMSELVRAQRILANCRRRFKQVLLPEQLAPDGSFPHELRRTKPYNYSIFNLDAMTTICHMLSTPRDNLWHYTTPQGCHMRQALEFFYPYLADKSRWPYPPDVMHWECWPVRSPALLFAGLAYDEPKYLKLWQTLDANPTNEEVLRNLPIRQPLLWVY